MHQILLNTEYIRALEKGLNTNTKYYYLELTIGIVGIIRDHTGMFTFMMYLVPWARFAPRMIIRARSKVGQVAM